MNYSSEGYIIEQLLRVTARNSIDILVVDLLSDTHDPNLPSGPVLMSLKRYADRFPDLVQRSGADMKFVKSATMILKGLNKPLQTHWLPAGFHCRVTCTVTIVSDENRRYTAMLSQMWPCPVPRPRLLKP